MSVPRGWQFFMHPGPTNIPHRVLLAMARPAVDFTGPEFVALRDRSLERMKSVLKTKQGFVITYAASGNGAWDASIANLFSPGDKVLVPQTGFFADRWSNTARAYGLEVDALPTTERRAVDPEAVGKHLAADTKHAIKAVMLIQNETATGMRHPIAEVRAVMNRLGHPALYLVDTISSLASYDFRMDEWGVDLVIGGSQKGLMLPPGMAFTAINAKAWEAAQIGAQPAPLLGLAPDDRERPPGAVLRHAAHRALLRPRSVARHDRGGGPGERLHSPSPPRERDARLRAPLGTGGRHRDLFARRRIRLGFAHRGADARRATTPIACAPSPSERYGVALGRGLAALQGRVFRIGHMGDLNEPMLLGALAAYRAGARGRRRAARDAEEWRRRWIRCVRRY